MTPEERSRFERSEGEQRRQRALEAQSLLENPLFKEAWNTGHQFWVDRFEEERDPRKRDDIWRAMRVFRVIKDHFEALVKAEKAAQEINAAHEKRALREGRDAFTLRRDGRRWIA